MAEEEAEEEAEGSLMEPSSSAAPTARDSRSIDSALGASERESPAGTPVLRGEACAALRRLVGALIEMLEPFRLAERKVRTIIDVLERVSREMDELAESKRMKTVEVEATLLSMLADFGNFSSHDDPLEMIVAFFELNMANAQINERLNRLVLASGIDWPLGELAAKIAEADKEDAVADNEMFRAQLLEFEMDLNEDSNGDEKNSGSADGPHVTEMESEGGERIVRGESKTSTQESQTGIDEDHDESRVHVRWRKIKRCASRILSSLHESDVRRRTGSVTRRGSVHEEESERLRGVLDAERENSFMIYAQVRNLTKLCHSELDSRLSLEDPGPGTIKIRLGSKWCRAGTLLTSGERVLFYDPFTDMQSYTSISKNAFEALSNRSRAEIRRELRQWSTMKAKNVLRVHGAIFGDPFSFSRTNAFRVALEPTDLTLHEFLHVEHRRPRGKELHAMIRGLCRGVHELHQHNILHNQLSSNSVLLSYESGVKIAGFGFTWSESSVRGSPQELFQYMSPEALNPANGSTSFSSDVFSLGRLLYEVTHGEKPFVGLSFPVVLEHVKKGVMTPTLEHPVTASLGSWFSRVVHACWRYDPKKRPSAFSVLKVVESETSSTIRASRKFLQSMLSFIPKRTAANPGPALETLAGSTKDEDAVNSALLVLLKQSQKLAKASKGRGRSSNSDDEGEDPSAKGIGKGEWYFARFWDLQGPKIVLQRFQTHLNNASIADLCLKLFRIMGRSPFEPYFTQRQSALVQMSVVEAIAKAMSVHSGDLSILEDAAGALKSLASAGGASISTVDWVDRRMKIVDSGAFLTVLKAMESRPGSLTLQLNGAGLIRNVSFSEDAICSPEMKTAIKILLKAVNLHPSIALMKFASLSLRNMSFHTDNQLYLLRETNAVEMSIKILGSYQRHPEIIAAILLLCWNLMYSNADLAEELLDADAENLVENALQEFPDDADLASSTLDFFEQMCWVDLARSHLVKNGLTSLVVNLLKKHPETEPVWEAGVSVLKSITFDDGNVFDDVEILKFILENMFLSFPSNLRILQSGLIMLQNISCVEDKLAMLLEMGVDTWAVRSLGSQWKDSIVAETASGLLCNLATPVEARKKVFNSGALQYLVKGLRSHPNNEFVARNSACAIMRMAKSHEVYKMMETDLIAGLLKSAVIRFPSLAFLPDLVDLDDYFPIDEALLEKCSVCLDPLCLDLVATPYECEHAFHSRCVGKWNSVSKTCPLCRASLSDDFVPPDDVSEIDPHFEEDEALLAPFLDQVDDRDSGEDWEFVTPLFEDQSRRATDEVENSHGDSSTMEPITQQESQPEDVGIEMEEDVARLTEEEEGDDTSLASSASSRHPPRGTRIEAYDIPRLIELAQEAAMEESRTQAERDRVVRQDVGGSAPNDSEDDYSL